MTPKTANENTDCFFNPIYYYFIVLLQLALIVLKTVKKLAKVA
ncbi:hypothetical protein SAMN04488121_10287 [Chitinophaga filiformis]|uniref:Uncharacterized protein n=1 Tax=Chitinophaga filiformis TaxID=104663 RepID=A0A1G7LJP4_CHIFI|nr:hypothetical protein SAMN04488121_10287 [Chitinophaga filiformis]